MFKFYFYKLVFFVAVIFFFNGCEKVRESAGVNRKSPDEFNVVENPPLVIPPDYSLVPPDQLQEKNIDDIEKELAEEILFGLDDNKVTEENQLSTMNKILSEANAGEISDDIRSEIDEDFAKEIDSQNSMSLDWENEQEVLDAIKVSERIRENIFNEEEILEGEIPIKKQKIKKKKIFLIF